MGKGRDESAYGQLCVCNMAVPCRSSLHLQNSQILLLPLLSAISCLPYSFRIALKSIYIYIYIHIYKYTILSDCSSPNIIENKSLNLASNSPSCGISPSMSVDVGGMKSTKVASKWVSLTLLLIDSKGS